MKKTVTLIGAGKLAKNIIKGLIRAGLDPKDITVVGQKETNFNRVIDLGVITTRKLEDALWNDFVFLCVQPKHLKQLAVQVRSARAVYKKQNNWFPDSQIISVISNQSPEEISRHIGFPVSEILAVTMDTNVATCDGLISVYSTEYSRLSESKKLLGLIGTVTTQRFFKEVLHGVTLYGAGKALDVKALKLICQSYSSTTPDDLIRVLHEYLESNKVCTTGFLGWNSGFSEFDSTVKSFLFQKGKAIDFVFKHKKNGYFAGVESFVKTISCLVKEKEITFQTLDDHIKDVATEGGCTEKGLGLISSVDNVVNPVSLAAFFNKVHKRAKRFKKDVKGSQGVGDKSQNFSGGDSVWKSLAESKYPL